MPKRKKSHHFNRVRSPKRKSKHNNGNKKMVPVESIKLYKEETSIHEMNPIPNHLFRAWSNVNETKQVIKSNQNISCHQRNCGEVHYKIIPNKFVIVRCHLERCNINDDKLIVLSPTLRCILFDLFMKLKSSSNSDHKLQILLQLFLSRNQIQSYGLLTLLNVISLPMVYVEFLSLNHNPTNEIGAYYINNYLENCLLLPHRLHLSHTKMGNDGIHSVIKGMVKRKNMYTSETMMAMLVTELEEKLKAMKVNNADGADVIISGLAINEEDKCKLYVPTAILVDDSIDAESLALNATKNIFVCTGADYKYIGHGECDENYCAVTATICTEEEMNINVTTLPLIHLFVDRDDETVNQYLSLILDENALHFLLAKPWNERQKPPESLIDHMYEFCYCLRYSLPINVEKWNLLLLKIMRTTRLQVDKFKILCLAQALVERTCKMVVDHDKKRRMEIKKYVTQAQNKQLPHAQNKWKEIIETEIFCSERLNNSQLVTNLSAYAVNLISTKWNIQKELQDIISSDDIGFILSQENETQSIMQWIVEQHETKSFGLKNMTMDDCKPSQCVTFAVDRSIINKYKSTANNRENMILEKSINAQILQLVDNAYDIMESDNKDNTIVLTMTEDSNANTLSVMKLHEMFFASSPQSLWDRSLFR